MTAEKLQQVEAAKAALPKATPGLWEIRLGDTVAVDFLRGRALVNAPEDEVFYDAVVIAAAPVLVERVVELEAQVAALKEWQGKAVPYLEKEVELCRSVLGIGICTCEVCNDARRREQELTALIAQAQGGEKA